MEVNLIRLGKLGKEGRVGFMFRKRGENGINAYETVAEALKAVDYDFSDDCSMEHSASIIIHWMSFSPAVYTLHGNSEEEILSRIREGLSHEDGKIRSYKLCNDAGSFLIVGFPKGKDPFPDAVITLKNLQILNEPRDQRDLEISQQREQKPTL
jgi:hypothetical protein